MVSAKGTKLQGLVEWLLAVEFIVQAKAHKGVGLNSIDLLRNWGQININCAQTLNPDQ